MHHCHANECLVQTSQKELMFMHHWRIVPQTMKNHVWKTYRSRGAFKNNPEGWLEYYEACANAVEHIARIEGKALKNSYRKMMTSFKWLIKDNDQCSNRNF